jgi:hypothetical protein
MTMNKESTAGLGSPPGGRTPRQANHAAVAAAPAQALVKASAVPAFAATLQEGLVSEGRNTSVAFLRDGGKISEIRKIVELERRW